MEKSMKEFLGRLVAALALTSPLHKFVEQARKTTGMNAK
jgi:hypothetical protein